MFKRYFLKASQVRSHVNEIKRDSTFPWIVSLMATLQSLYDNNIISVVQFQGAQKNNQGRLASWEESNRELCFVAKNHLTYYYSNAILEFSTTNIILMFMQIKKSVLYTK